MSTETPGPGAPEMQPAGGAPTQDDRTMGMLAHLLGLIGFIGPLIIWLIKKDQSAYVDAQGKEALNFQITVLIAWVASMILSVIGIGVVLGVVVWLGNIIFVIMATIQANQGVLYKYPVNIRLIK